MLLNGENVDELDVGAVVVEVPVVTSPPLPGGSMKATANWAVLSALRKRSWAAKSAEMPQGSEAGDVELDAGACPFKTTVVPRNR